MAGVHEASEADDLDREALAYSRGVDALSELTYNPAEFGGYLGLIMGDAGPRPDTAAIRRVLLALSARFDCDLIKRPVEPKPPEPDVCHECGQEVD